MKSYFLIALLYFFTSCPLFAQSDSIAVVKAPWTKQKITSGVTLKTHWFNNNLFGSNQNVSILEIKPKKHLMLDLGYDPRVLIKTSDFGKSANAIAALNGTFFDMTNGGSTQFIRSDGVIINETHLPKSGVREPRQNSALVFNHGRLSIAKWTGDPAWEKSLAGEDVMVGGPLLVLNGQMDDLESNSFNTTRHPRSAVAITKNGRVLFITVDGRNENSTGMSLSELTKLIYWLKVDDAMNLDGGGSTALWIDGKGVVNYPSDNKKWDHEGERKVANVVLLKKQ